MECRRMFGHGFDFFGKNHIPAETRVHAGENARNRFWIGQKPAEKSTLEFCAKLHFLRCPHIFLKNHQPPNREKFQWFLGQKAAFSQLEGNIWILRRPISAKGPPAANLSKSEQSEVVGSLMRGVREKEKEMSWSDPPWRGGEPFSIIGLGSNPNFAGG